MFTAFITAFSSVLVAEMGDKTQLVTLTMSSQYSPWKVLGGVMLAMTVLISLAVAVGNVLYEFIPLFIITAVSGSFFILMGVWIYLQPQNVGQEGGPGGSGFNQAFGVTLVAEMGDKTQMAVLLLAASFGAPFMVLLGSILAMLVNHSLAAFLGSRLLVLLPEHLVKSGTAVLFVLIGIIVLFYGLAEGSL